MKIAYEFPPNYDLVSDNFPVRPDTVFTYGDTLYSPLNQPIPDDLIVHEELHVKQQIEIGGPDIWWLEYIKSPEFRLTQEAAAYKVQYNFLSKRIKDRNARAKLAHNIATVMSSAMYGNMVSFSEALKLIRK